ncbi:MAG: hypothetical protein ACKVQU_01535 [Burkholderiales bacterium]
MRHTTWDSPPLRQSALPRLSASQDPGVALSAADQHWHASSPGSYLPVHALSAIFRAKFHDAMAAQGLMSDIPSETWNIAWNVNCQAVGDG